MLTILQNFFSTQFVSQEQHDGSRNEVVVSSNAWLFAAICVPLTLGTLIIWWAWVKFQARQLDRQPEPWRCSLWKEVLRRRRSTRVSLRQEA